MSYPSDCLLQWLLCSLRTWNFPIIYFNLHCNHTFICSLCFLIFFFFLTLSGLCSVIFPSYICTWCLMPYTCLFLTFDYFLFTCSSVLWAPLVPGLPARWSWLYIHFYMNIFHSFNYFLSSLSPAHMNLPGTLPTHFGNRGVFKKRDRDKGLCF